MTTYEKCLHCWHFIEPNDADEIPGLALAAWLHLDNGEKEHDHDAAPGGGKRTLDEWIRDQPALFRTYADGQTGPNSALFKSAIREACDQADAAREALTDPDEEN